MIKLFEELKGVISNPYIGFTSFQHFRNGKLYSDCITGRSGVASTETENYECYPVPEGVEENGREQGYYPDTTVAYIRVLWKEFEPQQGQYNYVFIEDILAEAKARGQTVMFRLMPHSTCERDDVPEWLKEIMECPVRFKGKRVKESPTDPRYLKLFGQAIEKFGQRFDSDETLDCVDIALGGAWGEGHQDFPAEDLQDLMDTYVKVFPNTKLYGQLSNTDMLYYVGKRRTIGWRADGTGLPKLMNEHFPLNVEKLPPDHWKIAPVSFESYWWISEWYRQGWDIDEIIEKTLSWHVSTFNAKSFPIQYELKDKIENWLIRMGYRFYLKEISYPEKINSGDEMAIEMVIENKGVAPIYNRLPVTLFLKKGDYTYEVETDIDICKWIPGESCESVKFILPKEMLEGCYQLYLRIGGGIYPSVKLATNTKCDEAKYWLADVYVNVS